jgi:hypothetical protein
MDSNEAPKDKLNSSVPNNTVDNHDWKFGNSRVFAKTMKNDKVIMHQYWHWFCRRCPARRTDVHDRKGNLLRKGDVRFRKGAEAKWGPSCDVGADPEGERRADEAVRKRQLRALWGWR